MRRPIHPSGGAEERATSIVAALICVEAGCFCARAAQRGQGLVHCPSHQDSDPSFNVTVKDNTVLVRCHGGCEQKAVIEALEARGLWGSPKNQDSESSLNNAPESGRHIAATYDYLNSDGAFVYQVVRYADKKFSQRRMVAGDWVYNLDGVEKVLYDLPAVIKAVAAGETVWFPEGEKDADNLALLMHVTATTSPGGANSWRDEYALPLTGADVVILVDKDDAGRKLAKLKAESISLVARSVKVLELPGEGKDVSDWLEAGGTRDELLRLAKQAPAWGLRIYTGKDLAELYTEAAAMKAAGHPDYVGIPTGLGELDALEVHMRPGDLMTIVAATGVGKSAFLLTVKQDLDKRDIPSLYVSLEMSWWVIAERLITGGASVESLIASPGLLMDEPSLTADQLALAVKVAKLRGVRVVFVDYAQRLMGEGTEYERVSAISNALARISREARVCIVAAAQVSRQGSSRDGKAPQLSEIRASGHIEQDSAIVIGIGRKSGTDSAQGAILKNRHGPVGVFPLRFDKSTLRFISRGAGTAPMQGEFRSSAPQD